MRCVPPGPDRAGRSLQRRPVPRRGENGEYLKMTGNLNFHACAKIILCTGRENKPIVSVSAIFRFQAHFREDGLKTRP